MPLVVKRKLSETWRDAVARRGCDLALTTECLRAFDELVAKGEPQAIAAYRSLARFGALSKTPEGSSPDQPPRI